ncbi:MAG: hypothetical protein ACEQSU_14915, partial [Microgenomates group bacterium]
HWPKSREEFWRAKIGRNQERDATTWTAARAGGWRCGIVWECALKGRGHLPPGQVIDSLSCWLSSDAEEFCMKVNGLITPLTRLLDQMAAHGAARFYAKRLAPNDNSKNQVYLGGGFGALNIIPHGSVESDDSSRAGSVRDRAKAMVRFFWLDDEGVKPAPDAQLILYPKYPEVRMSGFLRGAERAPNVLMKSRDEGRVLFFGIYPDGRVLGHVIASDDPVARAFDAAAPGLDAQFGWGNDIALGCGKHEPIRRAAIAERGIHLN